MSFLKKKGQGFPLLSGLGTTKSNRNTILKTIKATLRLGDFARNPLKPREKQAKHPKVPKVARKQQKITSRKGYVIKALREE